MEQGLLSMKQYAGESGPHVTHAMQEADDAITNLLNGGDGEVELSPQNSYIRRLQHQMAQRYNVTSRSYGREPGRRVVVSRDGDEAY
jgi:predicted RNA-binding protein Jag